ncbi:hypothetical protein Ahia01_000649000 [Argonauta hians]
MKLLEQSTDTIKMVEEENFKLIKEKGKIKAENDVHKESLSNLKLKYSLLEEKHKTLENDFSTVKEEYGIYRSYTEKVEEKLIKETEQTRLYYEENKYLADGYRCLEEDKELISKQLDQCETSLSELQSQLAVLRKEKDSFQRELNEEKQRLQNTNNSKEDLIKENMELHKTISNLQYEINSMEVNISNSKTDYRKLEEENSAIKKGPKKREQLQSGDMVFTYKKDERVKMKRYNKNKVPQKEDEKFEKGEPRQTSKTYDVPVAGEQDKCPVYLALHTFRNESSNMARLYGPISQQSPTFRETSFVVN